MAQNLISASDILRGYPHQVSLNLDKLLWLSSVHKVWETINDLYYLSDLDIQDGFLKLNTLKWLTKLSHHTKFEVDIFIHYENHPWPGYQLSDLFDLSDLGH